MVEKRRAVASAIEPRSPLGELPLWVCQVAVDPVMLMRALDEMFTGHYGDPYLDIGSVPDPEHLPWIDPTHPP